MEDQETRATAEKEGPEAAQETVASETVMKAGEMSTGWSLEWDPAALGELQARSQRLPRGGKDKAGAKRSK